MHGCRASRKKPTERALHPSDRMYMSLDRDQVQVLREILQAALTQLRFESARADAHDFREALHRRERVVESMLDRLSDESRAAI